MYREARLTDNVYVAFDSISLFGIQTVITCFTLQDPVVHILFTDGN